MLNRWAMGPKGRGVVVLIVGLLTTTLASSCGQKAVEIKGKLPLNPVTGTVLMNGEPMPNADVFFHPIKAFPEGSAKLSPHARSGDDGTFRVMTYAPDDGAPAAQYRVTVSWKGAGITGETADDYPEKVPDNFRDAYRSRLRVEVKEGDNVIPPWDLGLLEKQASTAP